jgi:hypothetical protein
MVCLPMGKDFVVTLSGGSLKHIGAVAVSQVKITPTGNTTTNVITIPNHKEQDIAKTIASLLTLSLNAVVCVVCGIHLEQILKSEIKDIIEMSEEMTKNLITQLTSH